jgi:hypothetical protein
MRNKMIIAAALLILSSMFVMADDSLDKYKPSFWKGESWDTEGSVFTNFWRNLNPFDDNKVTSTADIYNWYNGTAFGLADWESEVCSIQLSTDVRSFRDTATSEENKKNIYTTTITATAIKTTYYNFSYYEASWYVMPYSQDLSYRLYLTDGSKKDYIIGKDGNTSASFVNVNQLSGTNGYDAKELAANHTKIILEYKYDGETTSRLFESKVVKYNATD